MGQAFLYDRKGNSSSGSVLSYDVVCQATQPDKKEGRIWIESSVPMTYLEWNNKADSSSPVGYVYIAGTPGGDDPSSSNETLDIFNTSLSGITNRMKITGITCKQVQGSAGNWIALNAYVCHSNTWIQFAAPGVTPVFTYTGSYKIVDDNDSEILDFANWTGNWKVRFLTSGTLKFTRLNDWDGSIDLFLVGGGGGGGKSDGNTGSATDGSYYDLCTGGGGGGGGYTATHKSLTVETGVSYSISIGSGGSASSKGGTSSAFGRSASGGNAGSDGANGSGATGGAGGNAGGLGAYGAGGGGTGSGGATATCEFGVSGATPYAGGGGGGGGTNNYNSYAGTGGAGGTGGGGKGGPGGRTTGAASAGETNTGGGGGGAGGSSLLDYGKGPGASGGSGIIIIRNARG